MGEASPTVHSPGLQKIELPVATRLMSVGILLTSFCQSPSSQKMWWYSATVWFSPFLQSWWLCQVPVWTKRENYNLNAFLIKVIMWMTKYCIKFNLNCFHIWNIIINLSIYLEEFAWSYKNGLAIRFECYHSNSNLPDSVFSFDTTGFPFNGGHISRVVSRLNFTVTLHNQTDQTICIFVSSIGL